MLFRSSDEFDVRILSGSFSGRLPESKTDCNYDVITLLGELTNVIGIILGVLSFDILSRTAGSCSTFLQFPASSQWSWQSPGCSTLVVAPGAASCGG